MKYILFVSFFIIFNCSAVGQNDSIPETADVENISVANLKSTNISIDLANSEELEVALKKIHTFKFVESLSLEGEVSENDLKKLLYRLSVLKNLTSITLHENELKKIPENIISVRSLQSLTVIGNNNLDYNDLCVKLKGSSVNELKLIDNDLKKSPSAISEMSSLKKIEVSGSNELDYVDLIDQLAKLPGLTTLSIPVNYISELPRNIEKLKSLQVLDVSNNNLMELPNEISSLKAINNLSIQGNLLLNPTKDLEKLKGNNIQYLALDKEIAGEDLEQIKKLFPSAQIDFPVNKEEKEEAAAKKADEKTTAPVKGILTGELKAKKESSILSGAYLTYPALFQGVVYNFDTLNFEERYKDLGYTNVYRNVRNGFWRGGTFYFARFDKQKYWKKKETWFSFSLADQSTSLNYQELRAFAGMYWVYKGDLTKKEFRRKYLVKRQPTRFSNRAKYRKRKRCMPIRWNDIRVEYDKNNSLFTIRLKSDTGFVQFNAYPVLANVPIEKSQKEYVRRYTLYQKSLSRRSRTFQRELTKNKTKYDANYKLMNEYAWKTLQSRMSDEEKQMSREEWLEYYDEIIANEQKAIDNSPLSRAYILRGLVLRGYGTNPGRVVPIRDVRSNTAPQFGYKTFNIDFVDSKGAGKLAVANIMILDNKNKLISQSVGTLGLLPNIISLQQYSSYSILVELRNGDYGFISAEEIDKQIFEPNKTFQFNTLVFDKNLDTIGSLLSGRK